jgi:hypothetical protein
MVVVVTAIAQVHRWVHWLLANEPELLEDNEEEEEEEY